MMRRRGRASYLERKFVRRSLQGLFFILVEVVAAFALWGWIWVRETSFIRSSLDDYTRQEALTLSRMLLYGLSADRRMLAIQELEREIEGFWSRGFGGEAAREDLITIVRENPELPDPILWERAKDRGTRASLEEISAARYEVYRISLLANIREVEEDLWAKITLSDHLRGVRLRSFRGEVRISAGEDLRRDPSPSAAQAGYLFDDRDRGLLVVHLPLYMGLREWGRMECTLDRSALTATADRLESALRVGQAVTGGLVLLLLLSWGALWYTAMKALRREVVTPVVELAQRMEAWEQAGAPQVPSENETLWLSDAFDRLLTRVKALLAERELDLRKIRDQQEALLKAERLGFMEKVGAGLSHEINNALNPARLRLEEIRMDGRPPDSEDLAALFDHIQAAQRILRDLGAMARRTGIVPRPIGPGEWLDVALRLSEPHFWRGPRLEVSVPPDLPRVLGDPPKLIQAVLNLLLNAREAAMADARGGGKVRLLAEVRGSEVVVAVEDDGPGVPDEIRPRLFEPFATTKLHGSGLGLYFVDSVLRGMGGWIVLAASGDGLTRFEMGLALAPEASGQEPSPQP